MLALIVWSLMGQDLPGGIEKKLDALRSTLQEERATGRTALLEAIDDHMKMLGNAPGLTAEVRLDQMTAVQREREAFSKNGSLPFSAGLRDAAKTYLGRVLPAEVRLMKELDRAATVATKQGQVDLAKQLLREKEAIPTIVARYRCSYNEPNGRVRTWEYHLYSDGTANRETPKWDVHPKTWSVGPKNLNLVIINVTPESPKGGFKDVCTLDPDGRGFDAANQLGAKFRGVRID